MPIWFVFCGCLLNKIIKLPWNTFLASTQILCTENEGRWTASNFVHYAGMCVEEYMSL